MHRRRSRTPWQLESSLWHSLFDWQTKPKTRSASIGIFGSNASAMCLDDRAHDSKAHSEAFFFRGEELLKKPLTGCLRNPGAVIADGDADGAVAVVSRGNLYGSAGRR